uniref:MRN complex interacting protein n=1 Tax=Neovison vison TaxID=452646 RepID=A0A8C7AWY1_NEOVI
MAPPQRVRVLRCCSCSLFQAHQEKKGVKWTCKACGEKQSFLREKPQSSENRWLKYLEKDSKGLGVEGGMCFESPPSSRTEKPEPSFNTGLPKKRKWSQSTVQPPPSPDVQSLDDSEVTLEPQKDEAGLAGKVKEGGSHKDWGTGELSVPRVGPPHLAPQNGYKRVFLL